MKTVKFSIRDLLWLTALIAILAGWWADHVRLSSDDALVPAEGIVTFRGQPLADSRVVLHYPNDNIASGVTDRQGRFVLTYSGRTGTLPGKRLVVTVVKRGVPPAYSGGSGNAILLVPEKYTRPATSPLMVDIPVRGTNSLAIDLH
jgi:hypothetical protein